MQTNFIISSNDEAMLLETEEGGNPSETGIVHVPQIDSVIHEFHPHVAHLTEIERIELAHAIERHVFGEVHEHPVHHIILQHEEIHHFLDGMKSLARLNHIHDFEELQAFFNHKIASFNPRLVCDVK